ncbi:hypothetical protein BH23PLA1_BH23PLA1_31300 [soil metagenome]
MPRLPFARVLATGLLVINVPLKALADPPSIRDLVPSGVPRGEATPLTIRGVGLLEAPELIAPFPFQVDPTPEASSDAGSWAFTLTAAQETPVGVYPVRVRTEGGLSNPFLLAVGQVPQVAEQEGNDTFEQAQEVSIPVVIEGRAEGNDVDFFRFSGRKGDRIVIDAQCARIGSGVDPAIRLTTIGLRFIAAEDDSPGLLTDARMVVALPEDNDYVVELSDSRYQGGGRPVYRLLIGAVPTAEEVYPLGGRRGETIGLELRGGTLPEGVLTASARLDVPEGIDRFSPTITAASIGLVDSSRQLELPTPLVIGDRPELREPADPDAPALRATLPVVFNGRLDPAGDEDRFLLSVSPGQKIRLTVEAATLGSAIDGLLIVRAPDGKELAREDDATIEIVNKGQKEPTTMVSPDPMVELDVPEGVSELTVLFRDLSGRGGVGFAYRITAETVSPTFEIELVDSELSVPGGGSALVAVNVARRGFGGPIRLKVANPPEGLSVREGILPAGQNTGVLSLSANPEADFGAVELRVIGEGEGPDGPIVVAAEKPIVFASLGNFPTHVRTQVGLAVAPATPGPLVVEAPEEPIEVVHGLGGSVPLSVVRQEGGDVALEVEPLPLPDGVTVAKVPIAEDASEATVTINAALEAPVGPFTIGLVAKGTVEAGEPSEERPRRGRGGRGQGAAANAPGERRFSVPALTIEVVRPASLILAEPSVEVKPGESVEVKGSISRKSPFQEPVTIKLDDLPAGLKSEPVIVAPEDSEFTLKITAEDNAEEASTDSKANAAFKVGDKDYPSPPSATLNVKVVSKD